MKKSIKTFDAALQYIDNNKTGTTLIGLALLVLAYGYISNKQTILIKPPAMTGSISYTVGQSNKELKVAWADWVASLAGNINSASEKDIKNELDKIIAPQIKGAFFDELSKRLESLKLKESEQIFAVLDSDYLPKADVAWVYGNREILSRRTGRSEPIPWTYEMQVKIVDGAPVVTHFTEYEGAPRIKETIDRYNNQLDQTPTNSGDSN